MTCDLCRYDHPGAGKLCERCERELRRDLELRRELWRDAEQISKRVKAVKLQDMAADKRLEALP